MTQVVYTVGVLVHCPKEILVFYREKNQKLFRERGVWEGVFKTKVKEVSHNVI